MNQVGKRWRNVALLAAPVVAGIGALLMLPGAMKLAGSQRTSVNGIVTVFS